jgi:hypothetical protein
MNWQKPWTRMRLLSVAGAPPTFSAGTSVRPVKTIRRPRLSAAIFAPVSVQTCIQDSGIGLASASSSTPSVGRPALATVANSKCRPFSDTLAVGGRTMTPSPSRPRSSRPPCTTRPSGLPKQGFCKIGGVPAACREGAPYDEAEGFVQGPCRMGLVRDGIFDPDQMLPNSSRHARVGRSF